MQALHNTHDALRHTLRNWVLPWGSFCLFFLLAVQFVMWPVALLGALVAASMLADHCCD